jgi:hypothetical protein
MVLEGLKKAFEPKNMLGLPDTKYQPSADEKVLPAKNPIPSQDPLAPQSQQFKKSVLLEWVGPTKMPSAKKNEKFMRAATIIGFVVLLFLLILQEFVVILAVLVIFFVYYVINAMPSTDVSYKITNLGFEYAGQFFPWNQFRFFFMQEKEDMVMFSLDLESAMLSRLFVFSTRDMAPQVMDALNEFLPFLEKPPEDFSDKIYKNFVNRFLVNE